MAIQKSLRFLYQSKNNITALTDVKAQIYVNDVAKAVGVSAISATANANGSKIQEVDATNAPGVYEVLLTAADLTAWGIAQGSYSALEVRVDSASKSAPAIFRGEPTVANLDDIDLKLGAPAGASVSADIAAVKSDTAAIKVDLETGTSSLATILSAVQAIQNNAGFAIPVPATLIKPSTGSNTYRVPLSIYNSNNALVDPTTNTITVGMVNQSGADRGSYLTGSSGTPATVVATRDSLGQYHVDLAIPSTAAQEELILSFAYSVGGIATSRRAVTEIISDVQADGFALQTTLIAVQTTGTDTNTRVQDVQTKVNDPTSGLAAANTLQGLIKTQTDKLGDATIGLSAIKTAVNSTLTEITTNVEGAGFVVATDSLHAISAYITANIFSGGRAV